MLKGVSITDRITIPSERQLTDAGQMIVPCAFARTGAQVYTAGQLGLSGVDANSQVTVMRDEADVFDEKSMQTFRSAPVTIGHPKSAEGVSLLVSSENSKELQVGTLEGMPTRDEDTLTGTLVIARQDAIDLIEDGTKELSAGYTCDLEMVDSEDGGEPTIYQRNIRANHIAIVEKGRAGSSCAIADEADLEEVTEVTAVPTEDAAIVSIETEGVSEPAAESVKDEVASLVGDIGSEPTADEAKAEDSGEDEVKELADEVVSQAVNVEDELLTAKTSLVELTDELDALKVENCKLQDELDNAVHERVNTILVAKDLTDLEDFSDKSVLEIKQLVVADLMPNLILDGKSEAYVCARFDILSEEAETGETAMGRLLRDNVDASHLEVTKPSTVVEDARARATERYTKRS